MARLTWRLPEGGEDGFDLPEQAVLGRDPSADCVLEARGISRRHARIERRSDGFYLADLGSTNGTYVNGRVLEEEACLKPGDSIQIGERLLRFEQDAEERARRSGLSTEPLSRMLRFEKAVKTRGAAALEGVPESLPRQAGKFQLLEKLGHGGMGAVYRALDLESSREVAVKWIRPQIGRREAFLEFFHNREAVLAREIEHPNVIQVYEHGVESDHHYISMELVHGQNLYQVLKRRKLSVSEVLEVLRQVACGLAAAHRQGVVHSDIKPANLLLLDRSPAAAGQGAGPSSAVEEEAVEGILEFDVETSGPALTQEAVTARDPALLEEIRRRLGTRTSDDVLVDPPYFPRPSEMRFLDHYIEQLSEGRGFFLLVEGEKGAGKNRLISEFVLRQKQTTSSASEQTASSASEQTASSASEQTASSASEQTVSSAGADTAATRFLELDCSRIEGLPLLAEQLLRLGAGQNLVLRRPLEQRELLETLKKLTAADSTPTVVRLLDLGKATPAVCHLLSHWLTCMNDQPLLLLGSIDPEERRENESIRFLLGNPQPFLKELYLRPLTEYQVQRYLQKLFRDSLPGLDLASDLYRLSGGNFARLLDLLRSFFERGVLSMDSLSGRLHYRPKLREIEIEEGKNLYGKYRALGRVEQRVLEAAAFIGPRFPFDTLLRSHEMDETSLFFVVRQLLADGFFSEESRTWYRFTNFAFQRYIAERVPPPERAHLHRRLSRLLVTVPVGESVELFELRARHFAGCREYGKAVQSLLEAAHLARNAYDTDRAREMYQEILRIYRELSSCEGPRREVNAVLREWFRRDGNWYEVLGELGAEETGVWVKITDFGISFRLSDEERGFRVGRRPALGTPRYLAPERGRGEHGGPRSDVFSLGIIAYEMVVGEAPFPGLKGTAVVEANREQAVRVPPEHLQRFPAGFLRVLDGMLAMDSARRWEAERVVRELVKLQFDLKMAQKEV